MNVPNVKMDIMYTLIQTHKPNHVPDAVQIAKFAHQT